jgi:hypothetical protein
VLRAETRVPMCVSAQKHIFKRVHSSLNVLHDKKFKN